MYKPVIRRNNRHKRHWRQGKKVRGTADRPRVSVFKSLRHLYVQVIDDKQGLTLAAANTMCTAFKERTGKVGNSTENAEVLGKLVAELCLAKEIQQVVFDRCGYKYHGRIKALADAAREAGLSF